MRGLNAAARGADPGGMTTAPNTPTVAASPGAAVADVTTLLPSRSAVLDRLAEVQAAAGGPPHTLMVIAPPRCHDGWPTAQSTLARVTTLLAGSLRGDDFLGKSGPGESAVQAMAWSPRRRAPRPGCWPPCRRWASPS